MYRLLNGRVLVTVASLYVGLSGCAAKDDAATATNDEDGYKIGLLIPYSGDLQGDAETMGRAIQLVVDEVNGSGLLDKPLVLVKEDTATDADTAVKAYRKMVAEGVLAAIGPASSAESLPLISAAKELQVPIISMSATSPDLTTADDGGFFFRTVPSDAFQAVVAADYIYDKTLANSTTKKAAVVYRDDAWGAGLAAEFASRYESKGSGQATLVKYDPDASDYSQVVTELFANQPEAIFLISYPPDGISLAQAIEGAGVITDTYQPVLVGSDALASDRFINGAPASVSERLLAGTLPAPNKQGVPYKTYETAYKEAYGEDPGSYSSNTYDATLLVAYAIAAGATSAVDVAQKLTSISKGGTPTQVGKFAEGFAVLKAGGDIDVVGASGDIDLDDAGDVISSTYEIWKSKKGADGTFALEVVELIDPGVE